jgi:hypothetical protein
VWTRIRFDISDNTNIIHRKDRSNSGGGLLIYSKNDNSISRKSELENNLDETIWVENDPKVNLFYYVAHIDLRVQILLFEHNKFEFRSPVIMMFSFT